jgi:lysophospholipase L1-like esterase
MFKNYRGILSILLVAFALFFSISLHGPFSIGSVEIKASQLADNFKVKTPSVAKQKNVAQPKTTSVRKTSKIAEVDTAGKTILFIGDSMLDGLSPRLAAYAALNHHTLYSVIWYSSTSEIWGKSSRLSQYINRLHPNYIFICLGSNELIVRDIKTKRQKFVSKIVAQLGNIPYVWIGPPNWKADTGINDLIEESVPAGCFFKSKGMTFERGKDGAHPTPASAALWMDSVARWMPKHAAHPIKMSPPPAGAKARAKRTYVHQPNER